MVSAPPDQRRTASLHDEQFDEALFATGIIFVLAQFTHSVGSLPSGFATDGTPRQHTITAIIGSETVWTSATALLFLGLALMGP